MFERYTAVTPSSKHFAYEAPPSQYLLPSGLRKAAGLCLVLILPERVQTMLCLHCSLVCFNCRSGLDYTLRLSTFQTYDSTDASEEITVSYQSPSKLACAKGEPDSKGCASQKSRASLAKKYSYASRNLGTLAQKHASRGMQWDAM